MRIEQWLGENNTLGIDIWQKKYQYENESFDEWLDRISAGNAELRELIVDKKFLFGGRILANRGLHKLGKKVTYSNCYVLSTGDSIEQIYKTCSDLARTYSYGGGCGVSLRPLRPRGSVVNNSAKFTTGAVSFMETFSQVTETIGQNGRRGALMLSLPCSHPDLEEFIDIKTDLEKVTKANISVEITDDFMRAVTRKEKYTCKFTTENGNTIEKVVDAYKLFHKLAKNNWDMGEPGLLFWDTIEKYNLMSKDENFKHAGVNPCLVGNTLIQTTEGEIPIKNLVGQQPYVYCMDETGKLVIKQASKVWKTRENAKLVRVKHHRGEIICTPDHLIFTLNRGWVKAEELRPKDRLNGLGRSMKGEKYSRVKLTSDVFYYPEHRFIASNFEDITGKDVHHLDGDTLNNKWSNLQVLEHNKHSVITNMGHECYAERNALGQFIKATEKKKRECLEVNKKNLGKNFRVVSVEYLEYTEDVYDMTVPGVHNFIADSIIVHNCAEQPLPDGGSCLLGSFNLDAYVVNGEFNYEEFEHDIPIVVKAMNDVLDEGLPLHPLEIQRKTVRDFRQIGIGIMGLADALIHMGIRYDSTKALEVCDDIGYTLANTALKASALLAKDYGAFPKCNKGKILASDFMRMNADEDTLDLLISNGLRNSQILTVAPTGSISTMLGISGGIEPIFNTSYTRKTESLHGETKYYKVFTPIVKEMMEQGYKEDDAIFATAQNINPFMRIKMQSVWQQHIDASISSTVNLPNEATVELVEQLYIEAWKQNLKGLTIFRDGCARLAVLSNGNEQEEKVELPRGEWKSLAKDTYYVKRSLSIGCGKLKLFIGYSPSEQKVQDLYIVKTGQGGGCEKNLQALAISMSAILRIGGNLEQLEKAFGGISACPSFISARAKGIKLSKGNYCGMAILNEVKTFLEGQEVEKYNEEPKQEYSKCPECGGMGIVNTGGCKECKECGWAKCE